ncbi:hypothetical protein BXZ70DRAFT_525117 [Cristinia sonorae]|uniref:Pentacotripeptide-repeat region of PRORP domain-containing protein n=1 Tax=Cristinia sonorae TaxID=1940300 RepID=A0A8K0UWG4_9AGAR|nr:hypothetical protein BXZ70DRAFT_525117 [Cristinia sonorae]
MLPKVAGQILHHTTRAVAVVQGQTGHTIRNVLQTGPTNLGQWNGPGSSSSGWNGSGPSSGGAKFHSSSSRFHAGYAGAGRAVAQADASASFSDSLDTSNDEGFEIVSSAEPTLSIRSRRRVRSSSLSFTLQAAKELEPRSLLKAIQYHVRARHAFAISQDSSVSEPPPPPDVAVSGTQSTSTSSLEELAEIRQKENRVQLAGLLKAKEAKDYDAIQREVEILRATKQPVFVYNAILDALVSARKPGSSLQDIMAVYNEMIGLSLRPNLRTYAILIIALTNRDREVTMAISISQKNIQRLKLIARYPSAESAQLEERVQELEAENNFNSAMTLFKTAASYVKTSFHGSKGDSDLSPYFALLHSCVAHSDVDAAVTVYSELENALASRGGKPPAKVFQSMVIVYVQNRDMAGADLIFQEYRTLASRNGLHDWTPRTHMAIWNAMISGYILDGQAEKGLKLLEEMMDGTSGSDFTAVDVPRPSPATYSRIIRAFLQSDDVTSAQLWFNKLLEQQSSPDASLEPTAVPTKPEPTVWVDLLEHLASTGRVEEFNALLRKAHQQGFQYSHWFVPVAHHINLNHIDSHPELDRQAALDQLNFAAFEVSELLGHPWQGESGIQKRLVATFLRFGDVDGALRLLEIQFAEGRAWAESAEEEEEVLRRTKALWKAVQQVTPLMLDGALDLQQALRFARICMTVEMYPSASLASQYLGLYNQSRDTLHALRQEDWEVVLHSLVTLGREGTPDGLPSMEQVLQDLSAHNFSLTSFPRPLAQRITSLMVRDQGVENAKSVMSTTQNGQTLFNVEGDPRVATPSPDSGAPVPDIQPAKSAPTPHVRVDQYHSKTIGELASSHVAANTQKGYRKFEAGLRMGLYPNPEVLGRLINAMGRQGEVAKVHKLYEAAQTALAYLSQTDKEWQSLGWFQVEDQMIIALAHAGEPDAAHVHRQRILEHGGTPSADAYAALIQRVKDTTDDTANAMTLFNEARSRGVAANIFLYNTAISKLAKARKVDFALELFQEMKAAGFRPTSVTYGAVIAACCRVGDSQSAEVLFEEMSSQPNFKPRVPPFNTMMQLYTHTKPDRERVLYYAEALKRFNVPYTSHTYKLLMDAYGTIEPLDVDAMEQTFQTLEKDRTVSIAGTHWASLINAYGCAKKDLDKAISIFNSIASHRSSLSSHLPDAICFEALFNVLVTLKRMDLIPQFLEKLSQSNIHMTAYIANLLIKGHAANGDIEQARAVFESLVDPPEGVAAPNNHAAHDSPVQTVPPTAPVYREPSTWETMVRAELGTGVRDRALDLLVRLKARRFPPAVYNRISGILSTDPAYVWDGTSYPSSPQSLSTLPSE